MSWVDSPPAGPQGNQGTPEQSNRNSQFAMLYLHVLGILIPSVERIVAKEAMQDRTNINMQKIFETDLFLVNNKAKAISAELLELNFKNKLEETGKTR